MAQFPSYSMNTNQPMPNYQPYGAPQMQQPLYTDRMAQLQNYNQGLQQQFPPVQQPVQPMQPQIPQMVGRFVNTFDEVTANDVPMDGKCAIFPKNDMSEIQARAWQSDGTIRAVTYKPVEPISDCQTENTMPTTENVKISLSDEVTGAFMKRFDDITDRLEQIEMAWTKSLANPAKTSSRTKKETVTNE